MMLKYVTRCNRLFKILFNFSSLTILLYPPLISHQIAKNTFKRGTFYFYSQIEFKTYTFVLFFIQFCYIVATLSPVKHNKPQTIFLTRSCQLKEKRRRQAKTFYVSFFHQRQLTAKRRRSSRTNYELLLASAEN